MAALVWRIPDLLDNSEIHNNAVKLLDIKKFS